MSNASLRPDGAYFDGAAADRLAPIVARAVSDAFAGTTTGQSA
jgi:hypothetical protein